VTWPAASEQPEIIGDTATLVPAATRERVLAFGTWLEASAAQRMEQAVDTMRSNGRGFTMTVTSRTGRPSKPKGALLPARHPPFARRRGIEQELLDLAARHDELLGDVEIMRSLLDTLSAPVWARNAAGRLIFVNSAYARAVEAENPTDAVARELELLDQSARMEVARARDTGATYVGRVPAVAAGLRRMFDVIDASSGAGSSGMAIDRTEAETLRGELVRMTEAHRRVLDQLATGVAVFNIDRKLTFYNAAFRSLFELDAGFLDQTRPTWQYSTSSVTRENCQRNRISANGGRSCTRPIAQSSRKNTPGICRMDERCASLPRRIRKVRDLPL
jgi:PAS domain-containing protein